VSQGKANIKENKYSIKYFEKIAIDLADMIKFSSFSMNKSGKRLHHLNEIRCRTPLTFVLSLRGRPFLNIDSPPPAPIL
jgi:hypothetical protein